MASTTQTVTVELPELVYRRLQRAADMTHRSLEDVLVSTVNIALPISPNIPSDVADDLAAMTLLTDIELQSAAQSTLLPVQQQRLEALNEIADLRALTDAEQIELDELVNLYDLAVLRRAKALASLAYRGYPIRHQMIPIEPDENW